MYKTNIIRPDTHLFDEDGFLIEPEVWNEQIARVVARMDGIEELTQTHWLIIQTLREHYRNFGTPPMFHHVSIVNHLDRHCVEQLFHSHREAWRIAGLPNPGEEAKAYM